jgi:hypothetical protein
MDEKCSALCSRVGKLLADMLQARSTSLPICVDPDSYGPLGLAALEAIDGAGIRMRWPDGGEEIRFGLRAELAAVAPNLALLPRPKR